MSRRPRPVSIAGPFVGSDAVAVGLVTPAQLRGPAVQRLYRDVYLSSALPITHRVLCAGAVLFLPPEAVITGHSAATLRGVPLADARDPVQLAVPRSMHIAGHHQFRIRRTEVSAVDQEPWRGVGLARPLRCAMDLLLGRPLPDAVADLDAVLGARMVDRADLHALLTRRHDNGVRSARLAEQLADPRAESRPESRLRVHLVLGGLRPEPQFWISDAAGRFARADLAFPDHRLAVEYDGEWREGDRWALGRDRQRLNRLRAAGWEVVFVTRSMMRDPAELVRVVHNALAGRRSELPHCGTTASLWAAG